MDMRRFRCVFIQFLIAPIVMAMVLMAPVLMLPILMLPSLMLPSHAAAQGYAGYPNTIMTPERDAPHGGARPSRRAARRLSEQTRRTPAKPHARRIITVARGSSGSVLPTPLPRTPLIPPEGNSAPIVRAAPAQQGVTIVPGLSPVPNLPHGAETFQDRASRCAYQQGLYNVPGRMSTQYMGACLQ